MKKNTYGYIGAILALIISASVTFANVYAAESVDTLEESKEIASVELDELEQQLAEVMVALDEKECDIIEKRLKIDELELEYADTSELLRTQYEEMKLRIQYMYENSAGGQAGMLLSSENAAQVLNRPEYIQNISQYDRAKLEEYAKLADSVKLLWQRVESELELQEKLQAALEEKQSELNQLIEEKEKEIGNINDKIMIAMEAARKEREDAQRKAADAASRARELEKKRKEEQASKEEASREQASREEASRQAAMTQTTTAMAPTENMTEKVTETIQAPNETVTEPAAENITEESTTEEVTTEEVTTEEVTTEEVTTEEVTTEEVTAGAETMPQETEGTADVVALAYQLIGTAYMAGGASPAGFDCSGFTYYLYSQAGISLPRTSSGQALGGVAVASLEEAVPGDIICYPGHVGLYVGNGQIIHATVPGSTVKLAPVLYSSWQTVVAIRRYQ